jgi:ABC-type multidrug transport system permease subunit
MKLIEIILEIIGWFQIVSGVTLCAGLIAGVIYIKWSSNTGKVISIITLSIGFLAGVIWATRIWKKHGTVAWLSGIRGIS